MSLRNPSSAPARPGGVFAEMVAPFLPKDGNTTNEYEDAFAWVEKWKSTGVARAAVADGASEAYDSQSWARQLVKGFTGPDGPILAPDAFRSWLSQRQKEWRDDSPTFSTLIEEAKHGEGSFATFLGLELHGLRGEGPAFWSGVSLGDTVLFHVRGEALVESFPRMTSDDFAVAPSLVSTKAETLDSTIRKMRVGTGDVIDGDVILVATDALAEWALRREEAFDPPWSALTNLTDPVRLGRLVSDLRKSKEIQNDDVTLLIVRITSTPSPLGASS